MEQIAKLDENLDNINCDIESIIPPPPMNRKMDYYREYYKMYIQNEMLM